MNLIATTPARNEGWILGLSARAALMYCDSIVILDHASEDDTVEIVIGLMEEYPGRVHLISEPDPAWNEMNHRQRLLEYARGLGATHIAVVDADEVLCGDMMPNIRMKIDTLRPGRFLSTKMRNLHRSIQQYRSDDSPFGSRAGTMLSFADAPHLGWSAKNGYQHHQRSPLGSTPGPFVDASGIMHLQFASWRRLLAKHAAYKVMERLKYPNKSVYEIDQMYSMAPDESGLELSDVPESWWAPYARFMKYLDLDREPWQESKVRTAVEESGRSHFEPMNLFGIA